MYRVDPETMLPSGGGGQSIWAAYKPGTAPDKDREKGLQGVPGEGSGLVSRGGGDATTDAPPTHLATGTGGLY
jgi:hypothetical protein